MYQYQLNIPADEYDLFVSEQPQANLFQSSNWAKVKNDWENIRFGVYQGQDLQAAASLLIRKLPLGRTMIYIPRGPIMDYSNQELVAFTLKSLKQIAKKEKSLFVRFDPLLLLSQQTGKEEKQTITEANAIIENLKNLGCQWSGQTKDMSETIQPRFQANIYADNFAIANLSKSVRQAIRTSQNKGVTVSFGGQELLDEFAQLMKKTEDRKAIHLRNREYYQKMLEAYPEHSFITMAHLNLKQRQQELQSQLEQAQANLAKYTDKTKPSKVENTQNEIKRLSEELTFITPYLEQGLDHVPLAGTLTLEFGQTAENLYAGMDDNFRRYQAALYVWAETASHAFERGNRWLNLGGIENQFDGGLYAFKSKFEPTIEEFIGEFDIPVNPLLYKASKWAISLRKKLRNKH